MNAIYKRNRRVFGIDEYYRIFADAIDEGMTVLDALERVLSLSGRKVIPRSNEDKAKEIFRAGCEYFGVTPSSVIASNKRGRQPNSEFRMRASIAWAMKLSGIGSTFSMRAIGYSEHLSVYNALERASVDAGMMADGEAIWRLSMRRGA